MADEGQRRENAKKYGQIVARAWMDAAFKERLIADPVSIAKEYGIELPAGVEIKVVEDTDRVHHVVLPPRPSPEELSDEQLQQVAGGLTICDAPKVPPPSPSPPPPPSDSGCWMPER